MKTIKMNVENQQKEQKNEQLVKTHPIDEFNIIHLANIDNQGWQICLTNHIISSQIFETTQEAEEYIKNNLVKLLVPICTLCFEKQTEYREKSLNKN